MKENVLADFWASRIVHLPRKTCEHPHSIGITISIFHHHDMTISLRTDVFLVVASLPPKFSLRVEQEVKNASAPCRLYDHEPVVALVMGEKGFSPKDLSFN